RPPPPPTRRLLHLPLPPVTHVTRPAVCGDCPPLPASNGRSKPTNSRGNTDDREPHQRQPDPRPQRRRGRGGGRAHDRRRPSGRSTESSPHPSRPTRRRVPASPPVGR